MSGAKPQPALVPAPATGGRSPLAILLHALNQPLTGLQCSMELAVAGHRPTGYYVRTLQEGLELISRMRVLVEALREVADAQGADPVNTEVWLDEVVHEVACQLQPIAEAKNVRIRLSIDKPFLVGGDRIRFSMLVSRLFDSTLGLSLEGHDLDVTASGNGETARIEIVWTESPSHERAPFSKPELGLLIAKAEWEQAGAIWRECRTGEISTCEVQMPLICAPASEEGFKKGEVR